VVQQSHGSQQPLVLLVDGYNIIFRGFTSVPRSITSPEGIPVNGIYGLLGTLLRLIREYTPMYVAVAMDVPETPTFRHMVFPAYQGQRGPLGGEYAENFEWQVEQTKRVLDRIGIRWVAARGFEADDVIGTIAGRAAARNIRVLIVSTDRDLQQLVGPLVHVLIPGKSSVEIGPDEVRARLGISPEQVVDWKVIAGDPSDNVPGVVGIGNKTAVDLVERYGTWEEVYRHLADLSPRQRAALEAGRESAELFAKVVRINCDVDVNVGLEDLMVNIESLPDRAGSALRIVGLRSEES
jgi:DNA polymerase-1